MDLLAQYQFAQNTDFRAKVKMAILKVAVGVMGENPDTPNHDVIDAPDQWADRAAYILASQPEIGKGATDEQIESTVVSVLGAMQ
jgi:hypothetical protein